MMLTASYWRVYFGLLLTIGGLISYVPDEVRDHSGGFGWLALVILGVALLAVEWESFRRQLRDDRA